MTEYTYNELLELVYMQYTRCLDLDVALVLINMDDESREKLRIDPVLNARIAVCDARARDDLIQKLRELIDSAESEGVRLAALKELGRTLYPKRFKDQFDGKINLSSQVVIVDDIN